MTADTPAFDLQSHSTHSDGALPPSEVVARAAARGRRAARAHRPRHRRRASPRRCAAAREHGIRALARRRALERPRRARGPAHPRLRDRSRRPRRCWRRWRTSAPTAAAASWRWPTACASSASRSTTTRSGTARAVGRPHLADAVLAHPANAERLAREGIAGKKELFPPYLVPGAKAYVARSRPTVERGDRGHPRRRRRGGVGAPVLGRRRPGRGAAHDRALRGRGARRRRVLLPRALARAGAAAARRRARRAGCSPPARPTSTGPEHEHFTASANFELYGRAAAARPDRLPRLVPDALRAGVDVHAPAAGEAGERHVAVVGEARPPASSARRRRRGSARPPPPPSARARTTAGRRRTARAR